MRHAERTYYSRDPANQPAGGDSDDGEPKLEDLAADSPPMDDGDDDDSGAADGSGVPELEMVR
jgi:hypothetical protein